MHCKALFVISFRHYTQDFTWDLSSLLLPPHNAPCIVKTEASHDPLDQSACWWTAAVFWPLEVKVVNTRSCTSSHLHTHHRNNPQLLPLSTFYHRSLHSRVGPAQRGVVNCRLGVLPWLHNSIAWHPMHQVVVLIKSLLDNSSPIKPCLEEWCTNYSISNGQACRDPRRPTHLRGGVHAHRLVAVLVCAGRA